MEKYVLHVFHQTISGIPCSNRCKFFDKREEALNALFAELGDELRSLMSERMEVRIIKNVLSENKIIFTLSQNNEWISQYCVEKDII